MPERLDWLADGFLMASERTDGPFQIRTPGLAFS